MKKTQTNQKLKTARLLTWLGVVVLLVLVGGSLAWAQSSSSNEATNPGQERKAQKKEMANSQKETVLEKKAENKQTIEEKKAQLEEKKAQLEERACERIENRIRTRINRYENNQQKDRNVFGGMVERLEKLIAVLEARELDTADLEDDLAILKEKVANLDQLHQDFIDSLKETQQYACGQSEGQFKSKLGESRKVISEVKEAIQDIRQFYAGTVRMHLLQVRSQWQEQVMNQQQEQEGQDNDDEEEPEDESEDGAQEETETTMDNVQ